jgi:hypothetical protein
MKSRLAFVLFAAAMLMSILHEWTRPSACLRPVLSTDHLNHQTKNSR